MNNKYQSILAVILIIGVVIGYFTAESPFSLFGHKIHPSNCKCFVCNPPTRNKANLFNNVGSKTEVTIPSRGESSLGYTPSPTKTTDNNPYRNQQSTPVIISSSPSYQDDYYDEPEYTEPLTWHECLVCNGTGRSIRYVVVGPILDDNGKMCNECGEMMYSPQYHIHIQCKECRGKGGEYY